MSVYTTIFSASIPIGGLLMGAIASVRRRRSAGVGGALGVASARGTRLDRRRIGSPSSVDRDGSRADASGSRHARGGARRRRPPRPSVARRAEAPARRSVRRSRTRCSAPVGRSRRGRRGAGPAGARELGSGVVEVDRAGAQPSRIASAQIAASIAPDAPSGWPYSAFVPLTGTVAARSPSAIAIARASATSPIGVDEACALT